MQGGINLATALLYDVEIKFIRVHSASSSPPLPFLPKQPRAIVSAQLKPGGAGVWGAPVVLDKQAPGAVPEFRHEPGSG